MEKILRSLLVVIIIVVVSCTKDYIEQVKNSELSQYPGKKIGTSLEEFMGPCTWKQNSENDQNFVYVTGELLYQDKPAEATVKIRVNFDNTCDFHSIVINNLSQDVALLKELVSKVFSDDTSISEKKEKEKPKIDDRYLDYPIEFTGKPTFPLALFSRRVTPNELFESNYLVNISEQGKGSLKCTLDKKEINDDIIHYYYSLSAEGINQHTGEKIEKHDIMFVQIKLKVDHTDKCNYMTYFRFKNAIDGTFQESIYNEFDPASMAKPAGAFIPIAPYMFQIDKINEMLEKN